MGDAGGTARGASEPDAFAPISRNFERWPFRNEGTLGPGGSFERLAFGTTLAPPQRLLFERLAFTAIA
jgi:hypothetical protein